MRCDISAFINLASLYKNISSSSNEVSSIKAWLELSCHKFSLSSQSVSVFNGINGVILIGTRMNTLSALVHEKIISRTFITKKISLTLLFPKILLPCSRLTHIWG